jgi:hypothetical protein
MAPERVAGAPADQASDWYSTGVVLYEALTGRLPYEPRSGVEDRRQMRPAPLPEELPADLRGLCLRLLENDPCVRAGAYEVRAALGTGRTPSEASVDSRASLFVGRAKELAELRSALDHARKGHVTVAFVHGEPGIGKTALVSEFLAGLRAEGGVTVLTSRCHSREFIAYNAVDGLMDGLATELKGLSKEQQAQLCSGLPADLGRLFPVLSALPLTQEGDRSVRQVDPQEVRQRAFVALRTLLHRCSNQKPLVLHVDDLQWADADSEALLLEALRPGPHPIFLIASFRSADAPRSGCIGALRTAFPVVGDAEPAETAAHEIALGPLTQDESRSLAKDLSGESLSGADLEAVAHGAGGSPLFLRSLVWYRNGVGAPAQSLRELLRHVLDNLAAPARDLLELVALADRPVSRALLLSAARANKSSDSNADHLIALEQLALLRTSRTQAEPHFECYHDRVRETVTAEAGDRLSQHARLARAAASMPDPDLELVAYQYAEARELALAARFAEQAGDRAHEGLALDHAARLYALAMQCLQPARPLTLVEKQAYLLAAAGQCGQAAPRYLEAAERRDGERALELRLHAAEMYVRSGKLERSVQVARPALRAIGIGYPGRATTLVVARISLLRLSLHDFTAHRVRRTPSDVEERRIDACFRLGCLLGVVDPPRGATLILRSILLTLECGTESQLGRALASYAWILALLGIQSSHRQALLLGSASEIAERAGDPQVRVWVLFVKAVAAAMRGEFSTSLECTRAVVQQVRSGSQDAVWLRTDSETGCLTNLLFLGNVRELEGGCTDRIEESQRQGNRLHLAMALAHQVFSSCGAGHARVGLDSAEELLKESAPEPFCQPRAMSVWAKLNCLLYLGQAQAARDVVIEHRPAFHRTGFMRLGIWGTGMSLTFGSVALACAFHGDALSTREVRRTARALRRYRTTWAIPASTTPPAPPPPLGSPLRRSLSPATGPVCTRLGRKGECADSTTQPVVCRRPLLRHVGDARVATDVLLALPLLRLTRRIHWPVHGTVHDCCAANRLDAAIAAFVRERCAQPPIRARIEIRPEGLARRRAVRVAHAGETVDLRGRAAHVHELPRRFRVGAVRIDLAATADRSLLAKARRPRVPGARIGHKHEQRCSMPRPSHPTFSNERSPHHI